MFPILRKKQKNMANKSIKDFPESTSPSGEWFVLVDDGTGCYYKVKLKNLPGGGFTTTTTTLAPTTTSSTTTAPVTTSTTTTASGGTTTSTSSSTTSSTTTIAYDPDALAFFEAAGITDVGQKGAVNTMVLSLKSGGLWTKLKAVYPFVGGTATTHKYNLKNPADTDGAFRIVFNGGVTHNANGVTFNGSTGYGDTKFDIADFTAIDNMSQGVYIRSTHAGTDVGFDTGVYLSAIYQNFIYGASGRYYGNTNAPFSTYTLIVGQPYRFLSGVIDGTSVKAFNDGTLSSTTVTTNNIPPIAGQNWFVGAANNTAGGATEFSNRNYAFAYLGDKLSDGEIANLYTCVQAYQTALGRQV
jgi:hypothetical protein